MQYLLVFSIIAVPFLLAAGLLWGLERTRAWRDLRSHLAPAGARHAALLGDHDRVLEAVHGIDVAALREAAATHPDRDHAATLRALAAHVEAIQASAALPHPPTAVPLRLGARRPT